MSELLTSIARYAATLRHLRPVQVTNRVIRRVRPVRIVPAPAPPLRRRNGEWIPSIQHDVVLSGPAAVTLINQPGEFADAAAWTDGSHPRLWLYNLHYFDWLAGAETPQAEAWNRGSIARWIAENPPGHGTGWEPYPLSLRIANWVKWLAAGHAPVDGMIASLAMQVRYLEASLEWHLLGNHLLANAKALFLGGCLFAGPEGDRWLAAGERLLRGQWRDQVMADGGHEERSPMYQAILAEDVLDCLNAARAWGLNEAAVSREAQHVGARMLEWLAALTHPDGTVSGFNDAAPGIAASPSDLLAYAVRLGLKVPPANPPLTVLEPSGYIRAAAGPAVLLADIAPVGPDHQPGHAHADTLGFEFSLFGARVLVSAGTSTYEIGPQRAWERSSAAHNCVVVGGDNSSDVWAGFRTGRRARIVTRSARSEADSDLRIIGAHDGWRFVPGRPVHHREWQLRPAGLTIIDRLDPAPHAPAVSWLHLAPGWEATILGSDAAIVGPQGRFTIASSAPLRASETSRSLGFNRTVQATSLAFDIVEGRGECWIAW